MISVYWFVGTIVSAIILLVLLGLGFLAFGSDEPEVGWMSFAGALVTVVLYVFIAFPPFDMQYHTYHRVTGQVQAVGSRLLGDGKSTTQNFVVTINGQDYRCDDTRCSLVKVGDVLTLDCIKEWQWPGTSGYDCNFVSKN